MEQSKKKSKKKIGIIIFISVILIVILIYLNNMASNENSLASITYVFWGLIDYIFLSLMWILYLIKTSINKRKKNEKNFWIPLMIAIFIMVLPIVFFIALFTAKSAIINYYN